MRAPARGTSPLRPGGRPRRREERSGAPEGDGGQRAPDRPRYRPGKAQAALRPGRARPSDSSRRPQWWSRPRRSRTEQPGAPLVQLSQQGLCPCVECASGRTSETPTHGAYPGLPESQGQELRLFHVKQQPHNLHCNSFRRFTWNNLPSRSLASALPSPLRPLTGHPLTLTGRRRPSLPGCSWDKWGRSRARGAMRSLFPYPRASDRNT